MFIALSQSGRSPDLLATVAAAKAAGATILVLCNSPDAPLIAAADLVIELRAGVETSVAATKSYLATLAALVRLVAAWTQDAALESDLQALPAQMEVMTGVIQVAVAAGSSNACWKASRTSM